MNSNNDATKRHPYICHKCKIMCFQLWMSPKVTFITLTQISSGLLLEKVSTQTKQIHSSSSKLFS